MEHNPSPYLIALRAMGGRANCENYGCCLSTQISFRWSTIFQKKKYSNYVAFIWREPCKGGSMSTPTSHSTKEDRHVRPLHCQLWRKAMKIQAPGYVYCLKEIIIWNKNVRIYDPWINWFICFISPVWPWGHHVHRIEFQYFHLWQYLTCKLSILGQTGKIPTRAAGVCPSVYFGSNLE